MAEGKILIAASSLVMYGPDRTRTWISKGRTTVREGHPILEGREHLFRQLVVDYEIGDAAPHAAGRVDPEHDGPERDEPEPDGDAEPDGGEQASGGEQDDAEPETANDDAGEQAAKSPAPARKTTTRARASR
jgi:hypothetical protein